MDTADRVAQGYEKYPISYSLALAVAAVCFLCTVISLLFWWGAKGQSTLHRQNWQREIERSEELKRERNESRELTEKIRFDHTRDLVKLSVAAEGLARVREKLDAELLAAVDAKLDAEKHRNELERLVDEAKEAKEARSQKRRPTNPGGPAGGQ